MIREDTQRGPRLALGDRSRVEVDAVATDGARGETGLPIFLLQGWGGCRITKRGETGLPKLIKSFNI